LQAPGRRTVGGFLDRRALEFSDLFRQFVLLPDVIIDKTGWLWGCGPCVVAALTRQPLSLVEAVFRTNGSDGVSTDAADLALAAFAFRHVTDVGVRGRLRCGAAAVVGAALLPRRPTDHRHRRSRRAALDRDPRLAAISEAASRPTMRLAVRAIGAEHSLDQREGLAGQCRHHAGAAPPQPAGLVDDHVG
jgi:hypothetical protein